MLFNIEVDEPHFVVGYFVPDDFDGSATLLVHEDGNLIARIPTDEPRPVLVAHGRHATGLCGFTLHNGNVPHLAERRNLTVVDEETGILVFRRHAGLEDVQHRLFRLETHLFPLWAMDAALSKNFNYAYRGVERHGSETTTQLFLLDKAPSLYISGRLHFRHYFSYTNQFLFVTLISEPYYELAERLTILRKLSNYKDRLFGPRDLMAFQPVIEFASDLNDDPDSLAKSFSAMPANVIAMLSNPLARQLAAESLDGPPPRGAISTALANLSACTLVGLREWPEAFANDLEGLVGLEPATISVPPLFSSVSSLAHSLKQLPEAEILLELDLDIYSTVKAAVEDTYAV